LTIAKDRNFVKTGKGTVVVHQRYGSNEQTVPKALCKSTVCEDINMIF